MADKFISTVLRKNSTMVFNSCRYNVYLVLRRRNIRKLAAKRHKIHVHCTRNIKNKNVSIVKNVQLNKTPERRYFLWIQCRHSYIHYTRTRFYNRI